MIVKDIMSKDIACVSSNDNIEQAARLMKQHCVGSVPVCDGERIVGIVTDRDITLRSTASGEGSSQTVRDIMTERPTVGTPEMNIKDAAKIMSEQQIRRLPIVENDRLVGIVSLGDISVEPKCQESAGIALKNISESGSNSY